jgi:hypothetical protein
VQEQFKVRFELLRQRLLLCERSLLRFARIKNKLSEQLLVHFQPRLRRVRRRGQAVLRWERLRQWLRVRKGHMLEERNSVSRRFVSRFGQGGWRRVLLFGRER